MTDKNRLTALIEAFDRASEYVKKDIIKRPSWGDVNFEKSETFVTLVSETIQQLKSLPMELLPDQTLNDFQGPINQVVSVFEQMDKYTISQDNHTKKRDELQGQVKTAAEQLFTKTAPWIPYLAYRNGDVSANIERLKNAAAEAVTKLEAKQAEAANALKSIEDIKVSAQTAAGEAGVAVFNQSFSKRASVLEKQAEEWFKWTRILLGLTTLMAMAFLLIASHDRSHLDTIHFVQILASKMIILSLMTTATLWVARHYRALKHQAAMDTHRALSLQTFEAFVSAAKDDPQTKNAVLLEATKTVFSAGQSGFLGSDETPKEPLQVMELIKLVKS